jgi:hypothetical protein
MDLEICDQCGGSGYLVTYCHICGANPAEYTDHDECPGCGGDGQRHLECDQCGGSGDIEVS